MKSPDKKDITVATLAVGALLTAAFVFRDGFSAKVDAAIADAGSADENPDMGSDAALFDVMIPDATLPDAAATAVTPAVDAWMLEPIVEPKKEVNPEELHVRCVELLAAKGEQVSESLKALLRAVPPGRPKPLSEIFELCDENTAPYWDTIRSALQRRDFEVAAEMLDHLTEACELQAMRENLGGDLAEPGDPCKDERHYSRKQDCEAVTELIAKQTDGECGYLGDAEKNTCAEGVAKSKCAKESAVVPFDVCVAKQPNALERFEKRDKEMCIDKAAKAQNIDSNRLKNLAMLRYKRDVFISQKLIILRLFDQVRGVHANMYANLAGEMTDLFSTPDLLMELEVHSEQEFCAKFITPVVAQLQKKPEEFKEAIAVLKALEK